MVFPLSTIGRLCKGRRVLFQRWYLNFSAFWLSHQNLFICTTQLYRTHYSHHYFYFVRGGRDHSNDTFSSWVSLFKLFHSNVNTTRLKNIFVDVKERLHSRSPPHLRCSSLHHLHRTTPPHPDHRMTITYDSSYSIQLLLPSFISPVHIYQSGDLTLISLSSITDFTIAILNLIIFTLWVYITRYYIGLIFTVSRHIINRTVNRRQQVNIPNIVLVVATNGRWTCF